MNISSGRWFLVSDVKEYVRSIPPTLDIINLEFSFYIGSKYFVSLEVAKLYSSYLYWVKVYLILRVTGFLIV